MAANAPGRHRPASHPVVQRTRARPLRDAFDDLLAPRASIIGHLREERDPPLASDDDAIERIARLTAALRPPFSVGQRRDLGAIADALQRLAEGGGL